MSLFDNSHSESLYIISHRKYLHNSTGISFRSFPFHVSMIVKQSDPWSFLMTRSGSQL